MPGNEKFIEEKLIMQFLREDYSDFPGGKLIKSESPDFILKTNRKNSIGIELTRLHEQSAKNSETGSKDQFPGELLVRAKNIFEEQGGPALYVKCFFNHEKAVNKTEIELLARFLALYIEKSIESKNLKQYFQVEINSGLPDAFEHIHLINHPGIDISFWDHGRNYLLFDLQREMIEENIRKKEEKLALYRKKRFAQYWLVLVTMKLNTIKNFNMFNKLDEWNFQTSFDRILLYELFEQKVYQLNLE